MYSWRARTSFPGGRPRLQLREVELQRQILVGDVVLVADRDEALDEILELADVARPPVLLEHGHRRISDALHVLAEPRVVAAQKKIDELWNVFGALAPRRNLNRDDFHAVIKILAKTP